MLHLLAHTDAGRYAHGKELQTTAGTSRERSGHAALKFLLE